MDAAYRFASLSFPRRARYQAVGLPVPKYNRSSCGSYTIPSHTVAPPPAFHHSPLQVFAACSIALDSKPSEGSPGTVYVRHTILPVSASYAEMYPRTPSSAPALPMMTRPFAIRGYPVMEYGLLLSNVSTLQAGA